MNKALGMAVDSPEKVANSLVATLKRARVGNRYLGWPEKAFVRLNSLFPGLVDRAMLKQLPIIRHFARITSYNVCYTKLLRSHRHAHMGGTQCRSIIRTVSCYRDEMTKPLQ